MTSKAKSETVKKAEKKPTTQQLSLEQQLSELEAILTTLESGDLSLEQSLTQFEVGVKLVRQCEQTLEKAQQKINILMEQDGELAEKPFDPA